MPSKLSKWGNSLGVRLPSYIAERTGLRNGDYLYIKLMDSGDIVICQTQVEIDTEVKRKRSEELIHRFMWELLV